MCSQIVDIEDEPMENRKISSGGRRLQITWMSEIDHLLDGDLFDSDVIQRIERLAGIGDKIAAILRSGEYANLDLSKQVCMAIIEGMIVEDEAARIVN
jgi:hypothetical protein